jgi:hypothetical protein
VPEACSKRFLCGVRSSFPLGRAYDGTLWPALSANSVSLV